MLCQRNADLMKKRKAFLIGGRYQEPLRGVSLDIEAWKMYLSSSMGGCWHEKDEIVDLSRSGKDDILAAIKGAGENFYNIVIFSGHGEVCPDSYGFLRTHVMLDDNTTVSELDLNPGSSRALLIMDCCRKVETRLMNESSESIAMDELALNGVDTRRVYEQLLENCETGLVKVYAAAVGQSASDEESFSRTLIAGLRDAYMSGRMGRSVNIRDAVSLTNQILPVQQTPMYNGGRRRNHYPFAINPLVYE